jgi:hypothetical protein
LGTVTTFKGAAVLLADLAGAHATCGAHTTSISNALRATRLSAPQCVRLASGDHDSHSCRLLRA